MPAVTALPPLAKRRPDVPVEVLAARTLSLATLGPRRRAERRKESVAELEALAAPQRGRFRRSKYHNRCNRPSEALASGSGRWRGSPRYGRGIG